MPVVILTRVRYDVHRRLTNSGFLVSKPVAKMNEPARPANEHAHLRAIASGKDVSSAMDSKENVLASKKVGDYEAEDEPTHSANEQDGKNTSRVDQSSWSRFQFKQSIVTLFEK